MFLVIAGCKKPVTEPNSGIYRGPYYKIVDNEDTIAEGIGVLALTGQGQTFQMSGDTSTNAPLSCNGTYVINSATQMTFTDISNVNYNYDPNNRLDTTYNYTFDDYYFNLTLVVGVTQYKYILTRY